MIKPLGHRVLLQREEADSKTAGGLILPESAKEKPQRAVVKSLGTGGLDKEGRPVEFHVAPGDRVLIAKYAGLEVELDGEKHIIINEPEILAVIS